MALRSAHVTWKGSLMDGSGHLRLASGSMDTDVSIEDRVGETVRTNPEELLAGAQAQCYAMVLAKLLGDAGVVPDRVEVSSHVNLRKEANGFTIDRITVETEVYAPSISEHDFEKVAERAQTECPVSRALRGAEHTYRSRLNPEKSAVTAGRIARP